MLLFKLINVMLVFKTVFSKHYGAAIDYIMPCKNHNTPNKLENQTIVINKGSFVFSGDLLILKATRKLPALVTVYKCSSRADENCETYMRIKQKDFCPLFTVKGQFWTVFYDSVTPKVVCPLKKGHYAVRNGTIDIQSFIKYLPSSMEIENVYWKFKTQIYSFPEKSELFCVEGGGKLMVYRKN